jgi:hypothetical protein
MVLDSEWWNQYFRRPSMHHVAPYYLDPPPLVLLGVICCDLASFAIMGSLLWGWSCTSSGDTISRFSSCFLQPLQHLEHEAGSVSTIFMSEAFRTRQIGLPTFSATFDADTYSDIQQWEMTGICICITHNNRLQGRKWYHNSRTWMYCVRKSWRPFIVQTCLTTGCYLRGINIFAEKHEVAY